jgi:hypothetical protein
MLASAVLLFILGILSVLEKPLALMGARGLIQEQG